MKVTSLSVLPQVRPRANRRKRSFEGNMNSTNPNIEVNMMQKHKINTLA